MRRWPIRFKLFAGLSLVIGMLLTLLGGSIYGLHSFHETNLKLTDQLRELGASTRMVRTVVQIETTRLESPLERFTLQGRIHEARQALADYWDLLRSNASRGHRLDVQDELELALSIDDDLTAMLTQLQPMHPAEPMLPVTKRRHKQQAERGTAGAPLTLAARISRLNQHVMNLPTILHHDFFEVLNTSRTQWESSRFIVIVSALFVVGMMIALLALVNRWVLNPVRLLHRGVRRVTRGDFDYKIALQSGDEMQALAEAFNEMTERLGATYKDLERQVDERSRQLVRSERLAGVGFLAAGVAHEINNPLASIAFCSEALERRLSGLLGTGGDAATASNYLRMIQEEAFRCKRITEKLLDFSRCGEIQRERTDLVGLVEGVVEMIQHMGKYRGKQILFQPREAVFAHVDAQEIKQVVLNLVVNALDHMDAGATLHIEVRHRGGMAEIVFDDEGCGMSPETLENIFEPFFTKRRGGKGTGLGLSITHNIVNQHGGEITATSPGEGKGSTFTVRLPLRPPEREPKPLYDSDAVEKPKSAPRPAAVAMAFAALAFGWPAATQASPSPTREVRSINEMGQSSTLNISIYGSNSLHGVTIGGGYISSPVGSVTMTTVQYRTVVKDIFGWDYKNTINGQVVNTWNAQPGDGMGWGTSNTPESPSLPLLLNFDAPIEGFGATFLHDNTSWGNVVESFSPVRIDVFDGPNGTGALLGTVFDSGGLPVLVPWKNLDFAGLVMADESRAIRSAEISGTGPTQSFMLDAVVVKLPEPGAYATLGALALALFVRQRRRQIKRIGLAR